MMQTPYFITEDLEATAVVPGDALYDIRRDTVNILRSVFSDQIQLKIVPHQRGVDFFDGRMRDKAYSIAADDGVYTKNANFSFNSTRMYADEKSILDKTSYTIMSRDGTPLPDSIILPENESRVTIYDDGIFSGDTLMSILQLIDKKDLNCMINVLLNFSGKTELNGIPINATYTGECVDWIDERDFYYGVKNSGASIRSNGGVSGVPYISSPEIAHKKASIPKYESKQFCLTMLDVNRQLWKIMDEEKLLKDVPRLNYLLERYDGTMSMQEVLEAEKKRIRADF